MKQKASWGWVMLLLTFLFPLAVQAQTPPQIDDLSVEVWPEFDRPETLIIYRAALSSNTSLPADVTFQLPGYIENMHAVAVEQNGGLVDVPTDVIDMRREGDDLFLTFTTPSANIQFEYYDPTILSKDGDTRELAYVFAAPYNIETAVIQVQQPTQATNFSVTPAASNSYVGRDGLNYHNIALSGLASGDDVEVAAGYSRSTDELSVEQITLNAPPPAQAEVVVPTATPASTQSINWGYVMIGGGVVLLLAAGGYWWWSQRHSNQEPQRRPARSTRRRKGNAPRQTDVPAGGYCYRCGAGLRSDAQFCHKCGAERRS
jgi:hypothetical protein